VLEGVGVSHDDATCLHQNPSWTIVLSIRPPVNIHFPFIAHWRPLTKVEPKRRKPPNSVETDSVPGLAKPRQPGLFNPASPIASGAGDCAPAPSHTTVRAGFRIRRLDRSECFLPCQAGG